MPNPEVSDLPSMDASEVSDDILIPVYKTGGVGDRSKGCSREDFLKDVARDDGDHDFNASEIQTLSATTGTVNQLTVLTSLVFSGAATVGSVLIGNLSITVPSIAAGSGNVQTATLTGAETGDFLFASLTSELPDGITMQAWISGANTVSFKFHNNSGSSYIGGSFTANTLIIRAT